MTIATDFIDIIKHIDESIELPSIKNIFLPPPFNGSAISKKLYFGAIQLEDDTIGVVYLNLSPEVRDASSYLEISEYVGMNSYELAKSFNSKNNLEKTLGLGSINAISQFFLKKVNFNFDYTTDSMGLLNLESGDKVGMVGFFIPLVKQIEKKGLSLTVIEKREDLIQKNENWEVTLDPSALKGCNKILCTSTTVLNESINNILKYCEDAERVSIIGPTAGFIPDILFERGVDVIGGTHILDSLLFIELFNQNKRWGASGGKYCIEKKNYPGISALLKQIN